MPTFTQFIQNPQAFVLESTVVQHPEFMDKFIDYLTTAQDPLISNERECYLYPSKIAEILSVGMAYRLLVQKKQSVKGGTFYPHLQKLFRRIKQENSEPTLLGYCSKVLISLVKKTPQIYQFIKDNQQIMIDILNDDVKLDALKQFLSLFLVQSTMDLYVFLKSMIMRTLILRVVQDQSAGVSAYKCIFYFYQQILKALQDSPEDEKPQLLQVRKLFEQQHFVTLLILKLDSQSPGRSNYISNFLCSVCPRSIQATEIVCLHIDTILDYLEQYEESSIFMDKIRTDHIAILSLLVELTRLSKITNQIIGQLIKRLLVYSNVHSSNSFVHNLLFKTISFCKQQERQELLIQTNIIQFFIKNKASHQYGFMSLRKRIFAYWIQHKLDIGLGEQDLLVVKQDYIMRNQKLQKSKFYKVNQHIIDSESLTTSKVRQNAELLPQSNETGHI